MSHIDYDNIKKQRKKLYNKQYNDKKRQKIGETCSDQCISTSITGKNDPLFDLNDENYPENSTVIQLRENDLLFEENNLSLDENNLSLDENNLSLDENNISLVSFRSNETINLDNEIENDFDNDNFVFEHDNEKVLYNESNTSVKELGITLLSLKFKHKMSEAAVDDILKIFNLVLPEENSCPKSSKTLAQQIECDKNITIYKICTEEECQKIQSQSNITTNCEQCNNKELIEFAVYGLIEQLKTVLNNPSYVTQLRNSNNIRKFKSLDQQFPINSALDGSIHLNLPLDNDNEITISLNINTDGAPLIKSRNFSMWPVLASIVELNQSSRESFKNVILLGLWLHKKKPKLNGFFSKCYEELIKLKNEKLLIGTVK